jgi:hypothetical protein
MGYRRAGQIAATTSYVLFSKLPSNEREAMVIAYCGLDALARG